MEKKVFKVDRFNRSQFATFLFCRTIGIVCMMFLVMLISVAIMERTPESQRLFVLLFMLTPVIAGDVLLLIYAYKRRIRDLGHKPNWLWFIGAIIPGVSAIVFLYLLFWPGVEQEPVSSQVQKHLYV